MWPNPQKTANLVTFTKEINNGKIQFCTVYGVNRLSVTEKRVFCIKGTPMQIWKSANILSSYESNMSKISH